MNLDSNTTNSLTQIADTFNLTQLINVPTSISNTKTSLIDFIFCNFENVDVGVRDIKISDLVLVRGS